MIPKRFTPEPTTYISIGGTAVPLKLLPVELVEEYGMLDKLKVQMAQTLYDLEVLKLAFAQKSNELKESTAKFLAETAVSAESKAQDGDK